MKEQRVIKFRAWDNKLNMMHENAESFGFVQPILPDNEELAFEDFILERDRFTLLQWTGLTDKAGNEIYEDDILNVTAPYDDDDGGNVRTIVVQYLPGIGYTIEWNNGFCGGDADITTLGWAKEEGYEFDILGNVHQHKHLLK
jgi:uncharacterized phage protein (TIGR01671 family)